MLRERKAYVFSTVRRDENDEEICEPVVIDGACIRTPEEDIEWAEKQKELEAEAAKGAKGKGGKKK